PARDRATTQATQANPPRTRPPGRGDHAHPTDAPQRSKPHSHAATRPGQKVSAANTRRGNQVARWSLRTRWASSRAFDSSRCGSSPGYAVLVVMHTGLHSKPVGASAVE